MFQMDRRDNNRIHVWCLSEGQLWWDWLVAGWWEGRLARPQEDALARCGCSSSCKQKLPNASNARRGGKPSKPPTKGHVLVFCSFFASRVCECHGLIFCSKPENSIPLSVIHPFQQNQTRTKHKKRLKQSLTLQSLKVTVTELRLELPEGFYCFKKKDALKNAAQ